MQRHAMSEDRVKGLIYGAIVADALGSASKGKNRNDISIEWNDIECVDDWTSAGDQMLILMESLVCSPDFLNCYVFAEQLKLWHAKGFIELKPRNKYLGMQFNFTLNQNGFLDNPFKSCKKSYHLMGAEIAQNESLVRNAVCGVSSNWYKNCLVQSSITNVDSRCLASCVLHAYIINSILYEQPIRWPYIGPICQQIIVRQRTKKSSNLIEFNNFWHLALNYKNLLTTHTDQKESCYLSFLRKMHIGDYSNNDNQSYVLIGMALSIIIVIDIQNEIKHNRIPGIWYYQRRIQETAVAGGDSNSNAMVVGSIIGSFIGYKKLPKKWIETLSNQSWLQQKVNDFIAPLQRK